MAKLKLLYVVPLVAGCYSYAPISPATAPAGSEVRARITGAASDRIAPMIGSLDTRELVGNIVENNAGSMLLQIPTGAMPNVTASVVQLQTRVPLTASDLVSLEQRHLDATRTTVLVGAIAAGVAAGITAALHYGGGGDQGRQPSDPPAINRIPILRFRF